MAKVEFVYGKGGRKVMMAERTAEALRRLGHGDYQTRMLVAEPVAAAPEEPRVSEALKEFAEENHVDLANVIGTGKDGRIRKSDIEAVIAAQDLA
ncbi:dihydrolipoamide acetyltransferase [compost metagenome]